MQYQIQGQPYPVVVLTVEPEETVLCQKGAMAWSNVINLKRPLNGKQNVWKYQNGEEKSDSDGREKDV